MCFLVSADDTDFKNQPNIVHDINRPGSVEYNMQTMKSSTYMDTMHYYGTPIPAYCGSGANSFTYTITINGVSLPTSGITYTQTGG